jgi:antitoxin component of MazEF toxin-antitoxin module
MAKVQLFKGRYSITIPQEYVQQAQWVKGDTVTVSFNERGNIELKKVKQ